MIEGVVNGDYEAVIPIDLRSQTGQMREIEVVIDTGYNSSSRMGHTLDPKFLGSDSFSQSDTWSLIPRLSFSAALPIPQPAHRDFVSISRRGTARTLSRSDLEKRLERMMAATGVEGLNRLRDDARRIAAALHRADQRETLDQIIGALAGTCESDLVAPTALARARAKPYDIRWVALFEDLAAATLQ